MKTISISPMYAQAHAQALKDPIKDEPDSIAMQVAVPDIERFHVFSLYDKIADEFSGTRYALWHQVVRFLDAIPAGSKMLDVGCGNGKYLGYRSDDCAVYACDTSEELVDIARRKHPYANIAIANGCALPYDTAFFDYVISIAVMHHLSTDENRRAFVAEIVRVLKEGGQAMITVWAGEQEIKPTWRKIGNGDYFVPWKKACLRYYHLFNRAELESLFGNFPSISVDYIYERDNWHCIITKK